MRNLKDNGKPITRIKDKNNCAKFAKRDSSEANILKDVLYFSVDADVI